VRSDRVFIVVAAYQESATIRGVVERLLTRYRSIVVVDDASTDETSSCLRGLDVHLLRHVVNRGQGASLQTGIDFALSRGAEVIVTFDADGQHDDKDIAGLVAPVARGECDVCLGSRFMGVAHNIPRWRWLTLKAGVLFTRVVSGIRTTDVHNGLRAFSRSAASTIQITMDRMAHASEILDQLRAHNLRFKEVPVNVYYSPQSLEKGQSSWNAVRIALQMFYKKLAG
jgi:glycosyltransferase involved in cell wall biosynthesis